MFVATKDVFCRGKHAFVATKLYRDKKFYLWQLPTKISVNSRQIIANKSTQLHLSDVPTRHNRGYHGVDIGRNVYTRVDPPYDLFRAGVA